MTPAKESFSIDATSLDNEANIAFHLGNKELIPEPVIQKTQPRLDGEPNFSSLAPYEKQLDQGEIAALLIGNMSRMLKEWQSQALADQEYNA